MLLCSQKKTHPCEGCRERKKKCSGEYPCVRCKRLDIECVFLQPTLPPDHAYVDLLQQQELAVEVDTLKTAITTMENTMNQLRHETVTNQQPRTMEPSTNSNINWQLILGKHGITVDTSIKSYSDLLEQVKLWQQACQSVLSPSILRTPSPSGMVLRRQLPLWLLRRGYFMAITICVKTQQINSDHHSPPKKHIEYHQQQPSPPLSDHDEDTPDKFEPMTPIAFSFADNRDQICRQILETFFGCYHVRNIILHQRTFYRLFVNNSPSLFDSAVVCSVCALALTVRCRHMLPLVPYQEQAQVANMFCNRARHLVDFDEPTLDSFIVFTFLAMYKQMIFSVDDATFYLDISFRTRCLLMDEIDDQDEGVKETFKRLHWALWEVQSSLEYYNNQRGVPVSTTTKSTSSSTSYTTNTRLHHPISTLLREKRHLYVRQPLSDESPTIHQSLRNAFYRTEMMQAQGSFIGSVRFGNNDTIDLKFLAETEYRFTKFYKDLPADYRINPSLFELSNELFHERLDSNWSLSEQDIRMAALNLALQYYQGLISLYEPFLPDLRERQRARVMGLLSEDGDTPSMHRKTGIKATSSTTTTTTTTTTVDDSSPELTIHQRHAQEKCTSAATNIVRLLDYQRSLSNYCSVNMHILLTAWDIHMRNACLGLVVDKSSTYFNCLSAETIHQARGSLLLCLSILREGYLFNFAEHAIWRYYEHVERQLMGSLPMASPHTAAYWIPFGL